jgi:GMP synthase-like glutamine amidotransferase
MLKIAVLDMYEGQPNEGMRCIRQIIEEFLKKEGVQGSYDVFDVRQKAEVPSLEYDIFISTGGPGSPLPSDAEWEKRYFDWLNGLLAHNRTSKQKKFAFLICHSFQMVSNHFGFGILSKRKSTSFGVMPIHRAEDGFQEACFSGLPEPFYVVDSRDYQLIQPNWKNINDFGAKILALEKIRPEVPLERAIMSIRFTDEIIGTQFHPEADAIGMLHHYQKEEKKKLVLDAFGEQKYYQILAHLDDPDKITLTESIVLPKFLERAAENVLVAELA